MGRKLIVLIDGMKQDQSKFLIKHIKVTPVFFFKKFMVHTVLLMKNIHKVLGRSFNFITVYFVIIATVFIVPPCSFNRAWYSHSDVAGLWVSAFIPGLFTPNKVSHIDGE